MVIKNLLNNFFLSDINHVFPIRGLEIGPGAHPHPIDEDMFEMDYLNPDDNSTIRNNLPIQKSTKRLITGMYMDDMYEIDNNSYSFVFSSHVLEHNVHIARCITEQLRIVRPLGYVFCIFPDYKYVPDDSNKSETSLEFLKKNYFETLEYIHKGNEIRKSEHFTRLSFERTLDFLRWLKDQINSFEIIFSNREGMNITFILKKVNEI